MTAGIGYYQEKGKPARRLFPGDIVEIAPNVEHWHGAAPDSWFAHLAIECNHDSYKMTWLSPVTDDEYLPATTDAVKKYAEANTVLSTRQQAIRSGRKTLPNCPVSRPMPRQAVTRCLPPL